MHLNFSVTVLSILSLVTISQRDIISAICIETKYKFALLKSILNPRKSYSFSPFCYIVLLAFSGFLKGLHFNATLIDRVNIQPIRRVRRCCLPRASSLKTSKTHTIPSCFVALGLLKKLPRINNCLLMEGKPRQGTTFLSATENYWPQREWTSRIDAKNLIHSHNI